MFRTSTVVNKAMYSGTVVVTEEYLVRTVRADSVCTETVLDAVEFQSNLDIIAAAAASLAATPERTNAPTDSLFAPTCSEGYCPIYSLRVATVTMFILQCIL
jgi:hypothetical protein